jgi:hypothetical protein
VVTHHTDQVVLVVPWVLHPQEDILHMIKTAMVHHLLEGLVVPPLHLECPPAPACPACR